MHAYNERTVQHSPHPPSSTNTKGGLNTVGESRTEAELIELISLGDELAFSSLYDLHIDTLHAFVCAHSSSVDEAEDVIMQVFSEVWNRSHLIPQSSPLRYELLRLAMRIMGVTCTESPRTKAHTNPIDVATNFNVRVQ